MTVGKNIKWGRGDSNLGKKIKINNMGVGKNIKLPELYTPLKKILGTYYRLMVYKKVY